MLSLRDRERGPYAERIAALGAGASYPIGDDRFTIEHGADPFAFFDSLGSVVFDIALDGERLVAASARILREAPQRCWYLCGLKVAPEYRGQRIPARLARAAFLGAYLRCPRGYAVSMDSPGETENRVQRLLRRMLWIPLEDESLVLYSLDTDRMRLVEPVLRAQRGALSYRSLSGVKDIVLSSTNRPMPLLHAQFGPCARPGQPRPEPGAVHMFAAPASSALLHALDGLGIAPQASATLIRHRMRPELAASILTSEI